MGGVPQPTCPLSNPGAPQGCTGGPWCTESRWCWGQDGGALHAHPRCQAGREGSLAGGEEEVLSPGPSQAPASRPGPHMSWAAMRRRVGCRALLARRSKEPPAALPAGIWGGGCQERCARGEQWRPSLVKPLAAAGGSSRGLGGGRPAARALQPCPLSGPRARSSYAPSPQHVVWALGLPGLWPQAAPGGAPAQNRQARVPQGDSESCRPGCATGPGAGPGVGLGVGEGVWVR